MKVQSVRGTHDILPGSVELWQSIESAVRRHFELYGFAEIRTPVLEETELFARAVGSETDIVQKEMYTIPDSRGKNLSLRPEGTAPVVRAYLEHHLYSDGVINKLYYLGPMFRHERPQKGRYRQFHQIGAEVLGSDHPAVEAESIEMLVGFLQELGLEDFRLLINSVGCPVCRPPYVERLREAAHRELDQLCGECRRRAETNPLRVLDCKVPECQPAIGRLPLLIDSLCQECRDHFRRFQEYLEPAAVQAQVEPRLVRGLDYYVRTTFEVQSDRLGPTQNAILGGGRYDGLAEALGGPPTKGFGFAIGLERLVLLLSGRDEISAPHKAPAPRVFLAWVGEPGLEGALSLARELRRDGIFAYVDLQGRSLKAQMRLADRLDSVFSCIVGETESRTGRFTLKRMADGAEQSLSRSEIAPALRRNDSF